MCSAASLSEASAGGSTDGDKQLAAIAKKVGQTSRQLKRASWVGFWSQLTLGVVSAVIIVFSVLFKGITKAPASLPPSPSVD